MTGSTHAATEHTEGTDEDMDDDIALFVESAQRLTALKNGEERVVDTEAEIEAERFYYNDRYEKAVLDDDITEIEVLENPDEHPDHPVRVETDRFELIGKFGDEEHDSTDRVVFVMVEHPETGLAYNQVNGAIGKKVTANLP